MSSVVPDLGHGTRIYATFADLYREGLQEVLRSPLLVPGVRDGTSVGSAFGQRERRTAEIIAYSATVLDPSASFVWSPVRRPSPFFCAGLWAYTLSGSDRVPPIGFYNNRAGLFSDDGVSLRGSFGARLFGPVGNPWPMEAIVARLKRDPNTRRAVAPIFSVADLLTDGRDIPCGIAAQFVLREGALHAIIHMRSQSAVLVMPYDMFLFGSLQRWVASALRVPLGSYHLFAGSFHVYEDEFDLAREVVGANIEGLVIDTPEASDHGDFTTFEQRARQAVDRGDVGILETMSRALAGESKLGAPIYRLVLAHAWARAGNEVEAKKAVAALPLHLQVPAFVSIGKD